MKITKIEIKTATNGNPYKFCTLGNGQQFSAWSDNSRYHEIELETEIQENELQQKGKWWNLIDPFKASKGVAPKSAQAQGIIKQNVLEAQNRTSEHVKEAQERKDEAMKLAGAKRDAILIVTTFYPEFAKIEESLSGLTKEQTIEAKIDYWMNKILSK